MIEAVKIWNEPNNKSHWDPLLDPGWSRFAELATLAGEAIAAESPALTRVLGGISPIDPAFVENMIGHGVLDHVDAVAVHGFPLDWNLWPIHAWPDKIAEIEAVCPDKPIWATEVGVGSFGAEEVQVFGLRKTAELLLDRGGDLNWIGWSGRTPLDAALDGEHVALAEWLRERGARESTGEREP